MTPAPPSFTLEKPVYGGDCLTHSEASPNKTGKAVFIPLTLPNETVQARIVEEKRGLVKAELEQVIEASTDRVVPRCSHYGVCGGCQYQHADYPLQLEIKRQILAETLDRGGVRFPGRIDVVSGEPWGYRNRIRLAITADGQIGYRGRRSHAIVPIRECPIAAPILAEVALDFANILDAVDARNDVSEVEFLTNHDGSEVLVTFYRKSGESILRKLRFTPRVGSSGVQAERSGENFLTYHVAGQDYRVPHGAFFQVNRHLIDQFAALVTVDLEGGVGWDLYAGVGLFGRRLAGSFSRVVAVESAPASREALAHNLADTCAEAVSAMTLDFLRHNRLERLPRPDWIVLDPPRAGLGAETTALLNAVGASGMVYVSCDPTTLARDLKALTEERYEIESVTLADLFPQTFHLETVVRLRRV
jgi:23S rRNA (uracil1939-C5)-methyltransferase